MGRTIALLGLNSAPSSLFRLDTVARTESGQSIHLLDGPWLRPPNECAGSLCPGFSLPFLSRVAHHSRTPNYHLLVTQLVRALINPKPGFSVQSRWLDKAFSAFQASQSKLYPVTNALHLHQPTPRNTDEASIWFPPSKRQPSCDPIARHATSSSQHCGPKRRSIIVLSSSRRRASSIDEQ